MKRTEFELDSYCDGLLSGAREIIEDNWTPADADAYLREINSLEPSKTTAEDPRWRNYSAGHSSAIRALRDCGEPSDFTPAIDLIASRLWKLGAENELDEFLTIVGMNEEEDAA